MVKLSCAFFSSVSILARPEGRALPPVFWAALLAVSVSILARPEGRALQR